MFNVFKTFAADLRMVFERDPAARNLLEVLLCYPGLHALWVYRIAHCLEKWGIPVVPRLLSQIARWFTGVEIHPGATIGQGLFIDHGMGVVIGETAVLGDNVLLYQGVTLGGTGKQSGKRHPTLGNHVVVGAGAKVLGNIEIGDNVRIGAGAVVLKSVPPDCTVVGVPGRIVRRGEPVAPLDHLRVPDPEGDALRMLAERLDVLESQWRQYLAAQEPPLPLAPDWLADLRPKHLQRTETRDSFEEGLGI